jgi:hypothetical protein
MPLPLPPYLYDDPSLGYDEVCFLYDGDGYNAVCLLGPQVIIAPYSRSGGSASTSNTNPFLNIFIQAEITEVNDEVMLNEEGTKYFRFTGENTPTNVTVNNIKINTEKPYVSGQLVKAVEAVNGELIAISQVSDPKIELHKVEEYRDN